ncbi:zinc finger, C2H2 type [Ostertagia ostertagi]
MSGDSTSSISFVFPVLESNTQCFIVVGRSLPHTLPDPNPFRANSRSASSAHHLEPVTRKRKAARISEMVDVENAPPYDVLMKLNESSHEKDLDREEYDEDCADDDEALRIALENGEDEEMLDVESPDIDELDGSETSSSVLGESPQGARTSPENVAPIMLVGDTPQTSTAEVVVLGTVLGAPNSGNHIEKRHICDICGKGFPYHSILESHKRWSHWGETVQLPFLRQKICSEGNPASARTYSYWRTTVTINVATAKRRSPSMATKTVHEKSAHLGIRNYKCPKCDKCLSSPSALYTHKKTHGEKTFQCEFCPKTFTLKNYLKLHVKQVHEQNERKHVCRFCGKSFAYAGSLQVHVRTHTGERPYRCSYCPKAFASQGNLQSHERTHTGERPYSCGTCGRSFIQVGVYINSS